jgi:CheY-like chemotaxis protein
MSKRPASADTPEAKTALPTSLRRLFLVDDEPDLLFVAQRELARLAPGVTVETFADSRAALTALRTLPPDAMVTDLRMPDLSGIELIWFAREVAPDLPIVVVSAYGTPELRKDIAQRSSMAFVEKPFSGEKLLAAIARAAQRGRKPAERFLGQVQFSGTLELVQLYALTRATGRLQLAGVGESGELWFEKGQIVHAEARDLRGEPAVYAMLSWTGGQFDFSEGQIAPTVTIRSPWEHLLLEGCRLMDEAKRSLPEPAAGVPREAETAILTAASAPQNEEGLVMANVKESLQKLTQVDGFIGACIVDANSGMMLGAEGGGPINLEIAAAANTEVVRAKHKAMQQTGLKDSIEDILITLGKHYHLIRPLVKKQGLFIYLAIDRAKANLAMARIQLASVEGELEI